MSEEALQINSRGNERSEKQGRKGTVHPTKCRVSENSRVRQGGLLQGKMQRNRGTTERVRLEISSRKLEISKEYFIQKWAQ